MDSNHWDELLLRASGIAQSEQGVHDISRQTFADSEAQAHRHFQHRLRANVGAMSSQIEQTATTVMRVVKFIR